MVKNNVAKERNRYKTKTTGASLGVYISQLIFSGHLTLYNAASMSMQCHDMTLRRHLCDVV